MTSTAEQRAGSRIYTLRNSRNWTQDVLAVRLTEGGLKATQSTVARLEAAKRPLRLNDLVIVANVFDADLADFINEVPTARIGQSMPWEDHLLYVADGIGSSSARMRKVLLALADPMSYRQNEYSGGAA